MSVAWEPGSQNHKSEKRLSSPLMYLSMMMVKGWWWWWLEDDDEDIDDGEVDVDDDAHQACELCEEVAEVIGGMESEPRHAVAEDQPGAQHQLGKILNIIQVRNKKCEIRYIFFVNM